MEDIKISKGADSQGGEIHDHESLRSVRITQSTEGLDDAVIKSLKRKADLILLPMLAVMYLFK